MIFAMRCKFCTLCLLAGLCVSSAALATEPFSTLSLNAGYRVDNLDWSIAGNSAGTNPNVLSELEWQDMQFLQVSAELAGSNADQWYYRTSLGAGLVVDGENHDADYVGDNRTLPFSHSVNGVRGSSVVDASAGFGFEHYLGRFNQHSLIPVIGFSVHRQNLRMTDGNQTFWNGDNAQLYEPGLPSTVPLGSFSGLHSSYDASWWGPWVGLDVMLDFQQGGTFTGRIEYHKVKFFAEANWNLREDFEHPVSFEHEAYGHGWVLGLGYHRPFTSASEWVLGVNANLQSWQTGKGNDRVYFESGNVVDTRLNSVNWDSASIHLSVTRAFD